VLCAAEAIGEEPFAVLLGDSIIRTDECDSFTKHLVSSFQQYNRSIVGVQEVAECAKHKFGVLEGAEFEDGTYHAKRLIEKPEKDETDSKVAICARYVFKPQIFEYLKETQNGKNNEIQLTDAMKKLVVNDGLIGIKMEGDRYDIGDPNGLLLANLSMTEFGCD
jgi:UTP--glucose-1-phosphate uridylyltransferase